MLDYFNFYLLPLAIKIGMTPERFWEDDPDEFWAYWDAYEMAKKDDAIESNIKSFNQGQYFLLAIAHCLQFNKHPKQIYPKKPFDLTKDKKVELNKEEYEAIRKCQMIEMDKMFNANKRQGA